MRKGETSLTLDPASFVEPQLDDCDAPRAQPFHMGFGGQKAHDGDVVGDAGLSRRKPDQHRLGTAASKARRNVEYLARPQGHAHLSRHACSISTVHSGGQLQTFDNDDGRLCSSRQNWRSVYSDYTSPPRTDSRRLSFYLFLRSSMKR